MIRHVTVGVVAADTNLGTDAGVVAILNRHATADVFARADGTAAVVDADDCRVIPPGSRRTLEVSSDGPTVISMIATVAGVKVEVDA